MKRKPKEEKRFVALADALSLTVPLAEELCRAAEKTWALIGPDCLNACDGRMSRDEVVEVVMDADHIRTNTRNLSAVLHEVLKHWEYFPIIDILLREFVFVYKWYEI